MNAATTDVTGFAVQPLPFYLRAANGMAAWAGSDDAVLHPDRLMQDAARMAGLPPDYPPHVREALEVLSASLRSEAKLHWFGRANVYDLLTTGLSALLQVEKAFKDDPSLANEPLVPPIVVSGLPRSGTTYLHRLLSEVSGAATVRMYEHMFPVPYRPWDYRLTETKVKFLPWQWASNAYGMDAMHRIRPDLPDECNFGMRLAGRTMLYWATAPTYGYLDWLLAQDLRESYALYRKVLILHQRAYPGRRLTLKCPHHLAWLPALREALPEALIVMTHRNPVECVPSECKLVLSLQAMSVTDIDWRRTVQGNSSKVRVFAERAVAFDASGATGVAHVSYKELVKDAVATVAKIHADLGLPFTDADRAVLAAFASENKQHKHGKNAYSVEQFGLSAGAITEAFAGYRGRFLDPEQ